MADFIRACVEVHVLRACRTTVESVTSISSTLVTDVRVCVCACVPGGGN